MIKEFACYAAACDVCGETPESDFGYGVDHFDDPTAALEKAREEDWWATEAVVLCSSWDRKHIERAQEVAKSLQCDEEALSDFRFHVPDFLWDEISSQAVAA